MAECIEFDERALYLSDKLDRPYQYMEEIPMLAILKIQAHISPSGRNKLYKLFKFDIKHKFTLATSLATLLQSRLYTCIYTHPRYDVYKNYIPLLFE